MSAAWGDGPEGVRNVMRFVGGFSCLRGRLVGVALVAAVALSGCGGSSKADDAASDKKSDTEVPAGAGEHATTSTTAAAKGTAPSSKSSGGGGATTSTTAVTAGGGTAGSDAKAAKENPYTRTLKIEAELAEACVRPGGAQTVTVRTMPSAGVGFDTEYADYLTGMMKDHYGGNAAGFTDDDGTWKSSWVVAPNAPAGLTTVLVLGSHETGGIGETKAVFQVADALGKCA